MKCACPWCSEDVQEGCESPMGQPVCYEHSWEAILETVKDVLKELAKPCPKKKPDANTS